MLWDSELITKSFLNEINEFLVVLDTRGDDQTFLRSDVIHNKLTHHTSINVVDVLG